MSSGSWLQAREPSRHVANFRPSGMSDEEDDEDEYDFGGLSYGNANYEDGGNWEGQVGGDEICEPVMSSLGGRGEADSSLGQALKFAIAVGSVDDVKKEIGKLKEKIFDINKPLDDEWNALLYACYAARPEILEILVIEGADVQKSSLDHVNGMIALASSCNENHKDVVACAKILVDAGIDVNECDYQIGASALHFAVKNENMELIDFLCDNGADVNILDGERKTPLSWAAGRGLGPVVRKLLSYNADVQVVNKNGICAYELAAFEGFPQLAKVLYLYGKAEDKSTVDLTPLERNEVENEGNYVAPIQGNPFGRDYVGDILCHIKLQKYTPIFQERRMTLDQFLQLRDDDFVNLGITPVGERIKLMDTIRQIHNYDWRPSSVMSLTASRMTASETLMMCENYETHLKLMTKTMEYLIAHANVKPEESCLFNAGLENSEPGRIQGYCVKLVASVRSLMNPLGKLKNLITCVKDDSGYRVGDLVLKSSK